MQKLLRTHNWAKNSAEALSDRLNPGQWFCWVLEELQHTTKTVKDRGLNKT